MWYRLRTRRYTRNCPECCGNPQLLCRGTRSSNPTPSSGESANHRFRGRGPQGVYRALAGSGATTDPAPSPYHYRKDPFFQDTGPEPFLDQADDPPVADPMFHKAGEPFLADFIEERSDVGRP